MGYQKKHREIIDDLKFDFNCMYDEKDSIGKRYRRMDALAHHLRNCRPSDIRNNTVTIRYRDTMEQDRVEISKLRAIISEAVSMKGLFAKLK
jgi:glycyl-tRNA synthetase